MRRGLFEGDAAAIELRARLKQARGGIPPMAVRDPAPSRLGAAFRFIGFVMIAAALAGAAGYVVGTVKLSTKSARLAKSDLLAAASTEADMPLAPLMLPEPRNPPDHDSEPQTAAIDTATVTSDRASDDAPAGGGAQQPGRPASRPAPQPPLPRPDASGIAARMKIGSDLMAAGDVAAARTMFQRVAEAGDAAGAFALAETYDPAVLKTLHLRGGITPDPVLARRWYEKARDMGSSAAPERISRLRQNPQ
jgi:TPR repeat protein